jgi:penicillin-insensitive murein endopeptidase
MTPSSPALAALSLTTLSLWGCLGTPTPLAPGLGGSVGWPHHGVQTGAVELPQAGPGFVRYRKVGGFNWGQPGLVQAVQAAAREVQSALPGGGPLVVGDLSARDGGQVVRHATHRSGRDVDLLWYMTTPEGAPIENSHFVQLGSDGLGRSPDGGFVQLDVAREWLLVKSLLSSEQIEAQWMFASHPVEALLIDYAIASGEDPELIWRAESVLQEPADSLPHDDHLHLRIACSPQASVRGCRGGGPYWSWLPTLPQGLLPQDRQALGAELGAAELGPAELDPGELDGSDLEELL